MTCRSWLYIFIPCASPIEVTCWCLLFYVESEWVKCTLIPHHVKDGNEFMDVFVLCWISNIPSFAWSLCHCFLVCWLFDHFPISLFIWYVVIIYAHQMKHRGEILLGNSIFIHCVYASPYNPLNIIKHTIIKTKLSLKCPKTGQLSKPQISPI